jgi:YggT family protein
MTTVWLSLAFAVLLVIILVQARLVVDWTRYFARSWWPTGPAAVGIEIIYTTTDWPIKLLRKLVPPLRLGGATVDLSVMILFLMLLILRQVFLQLA